MVLLVGLFRPAFIREQIVPVLALVTLGVAIGLEIWRFDHHAQIISGALVIDDLALDPRS